MKREEVILPEPGRSLLRNTWATEELRALQREAMLQ